MDVSLPGTKVVGPQKRLQDKFVDTYLRVTYCMNVTPLSLIETLTCNKTKAVKKLQ